MNFQIEMSNKIMHINRLPLNVKKYLARNGEFFRNPDRTKSKLYDLVVVIPALAELENSKKLLKSLENNPKSKNTLVLIVVNNRAESTNKVKTENKKLIEFLGSRIRKTRKFDLNFIDASSPGKELPEKFAGVGLARKIGMDYALTVFDYSSNSKKIIACLDADCLVEENYFRTITDNYTKLNLSAAVIDFEHQTPNDSKQHLAIVNYEIFLRYYVLGLKYANSLYAFHTIGSTITVDYENYIKIGGMNKKKAGEDFYFMEKLAKVTHIGRLKTTKVYPSARKSWRVPFGTGQRISKFLTNSRDEYFLYNPESFEILKKWLEVFNSTEVSDAKEYLKEAEKINPQLKNFLKSAGFENDWQKILKNSGNLRQIMHQKKLWFDGFRTLKLIHFLRDNGYPDIEMFDAVDILLSKLGTETGINRTSGIPPLETQLEYLQKLKEKELD